MAYIAHRIRPVSWYDHPGGLDGRVTWSRRFGGGHTQGVGLIGVTFDNQTVTAGTSKKPCPGGFFDDNSSNNLTIEVGTHPVVGRTIGGHISSLKRPLF